MVKMTKEEFDQVFNILCVNYPNTKNKNELGSLYFLALNNELTKKEFLAIVLKIIKTSKSAFMPQIAEILEIAKKGKNIEQQVFFAKKLLIYGIRKVGRTGMIAFEDKGIHAVIDFVGWTRLCNMEQKEFDNFINFQFDGIYKGFIERPYATSNYFKGTYEAIGQVEPQKITYENIGVTENKQDFIALNYRYEPKNKNIDYKNLKTKMLVGG